MRVDGPRGRLGAVRCSICMIEGRRDGTERFLPDLWKPLASSLPFDQAICVARRVVWRRFIRCSPMRWRRYYQFLMLLLLLRRVRMQEVLLVRSLSLPLLCLQAELQARI